MAHELDFSTGRAAMFSVKEIPWHGLGEIVMEAPDTQTAIKLAGLDWNVDLRSLFTVKRDIKTGDLILDEKQEDIRAVYRTDNGKVLGYVGADYHYVQNKSAFKIFDSFIEDGSASLETAGSLKDGRIIWILAVINKDPAVIVPKADDTVKRYVLLSNSHDGSLALSFGFTNIRVVCNNTLTMALSGKRGDSAIIRFKHTKNIEANIEALKETMNVMDAKFEASVEQYRKLANCQINQKDLENYVNVVFSLGREKSGNVYLNDEFDGPIEEEQFEVSSRFMNNIVEKFETGIGNDLPGVRGTAWAAYNAVTQYLSHERGRSEENRFNSLYFAEGARLNQRALKEALNLTR